MQFFQILQIYAIYHCEKTGLLDSCENKLFLK